MKTGRSLREPMSDKFVVVHKRFGSMEVKNPRYGLRCGSVLTLSDQYGIQVERKGDELWFCAPRDRLQTFLEKLHFGQVPYTIRKS